ncbi:hypothetical protein ACIRRA_17635 [Nocardia sp. NPDC101769]|uniref:hypothetical protein n=1 Tax=Nocardia sp. NPDC101769 TaxID=3364333 RepID=UPI0038307A01
MTEPAIAGRRQPEPGAVQNVRYGRLQGVVAPCMTEAITDMAAGTDQMSSGHFGQDTIRAVGSLRETGFAEVGEAGVAEFVEVPADAGPVGASPVVPDPGL